MSDRPVRWIKLDPFPIEAIAELKSAFPDARISQEVLLCIVAITSGNWRSLGHIFSNILQHVDLDDSPIKQLKRLTVSIGSLIGCPSFFLFFCFDYRHSQRKKKKKKKKKKKTNS